MPRHENPLNDPVDSDGRLSAQLRQSRKAAGFGLAQAARLAGWSPNHLSQVENGKQTPSELLVLDLDVLYEADGLLVSLYEEVLAERRHRALEQAMRNRGRVRPNISEADGQPRWSPPADVALPIDGDEAGFGGDISAPAGIVLARGDYFLKTWRITNTGSVEWRDRYLRRVGPNAASTLVTSPRAVELPLALPGQTIDVTVACRAQWIPSTSVAHFKMVFADGRLCWPDRYSHGLDLLVIAVEGEGCGCQACLSVDPRALHTTQSSRERSVWLRNSSSATVTRAAVSG